MDLSREELLEEEQRFRALNAENSAKCAQISPERFRAYEEYRANLPSGFGGRTYPRFEDAEVANLADEAAWISEQLESIGSWLAEME